MAVDRLADDDPEEISGGLCGQHELRQQPGTGMSAGTEIVEPRTRAEYYQARRPPLTGQAHQRTPRRNPPGTTPTPALVRR